MPPLPSRVTVLIEVPRLGFVKREADGGVDFVSPLPSPFNYGCLPETLGEDGDPLDALVLGPRLPAGARVEVQVRGVVRFRDHGARDDKLVCGARPLSRTDRVVIRAFFTGYARARALLDRARGRPGDVVFLGLEEP